MNRILAIFVWELRQCLASRFLRVFALACVAGGAALLAAAPQPEVLAMVLIQAILFFGSLFAMLIGWASGQQARQEGAFLFAQPITPTERLAGQLGGVGCWCLVLLVLFMAPAALRAGMPQMLLVLGGLSVGMILVCVLAGLIIGLTVSTVSGLLAVLLSWAVAIAGWELGLLLLADTAWIQRSPGLFITLLLANPLGTFRIAALIGVDAVPFDTDELQTGKWFFQNLWAGTALIMTAWVSLLSLIGIRALSRQTF